MKPSFRLSLPNGVLGDTLVVVSSRWSGRLRLFDAGDSSALGPRELLSVGQVFLSHAHVDHAYGLARLLRSRIGRPERPLALFGPPGLAAQIRSHLSGYTWNLVEAFPLTMTIVEVHEDRVESWEFPRERGFDLMPRGTHEWADGGAVHESLDLVARAAVLTHGTTRSIAWRLDEPRRFNVDPDALSLRGLRPGRWLTRLKDALLAGEADRPIETPDGSVAPAGRLASELIRESEGDSLAFAVDADATAGNLGRLETLSRGARRLLIECYYLAADEDLARRNNHLTAAIAGALARRAECGSVSPLHVSPRYESRVEEVFEELRRAASPVPVRLLEPADGD